jgi:hypothetical protein
MNVPVVQPLTGVRWLASAASIAAAAVLAVAHGIRLVSEIDVSQWWIPLAIVSGVVAADFSSGVVHWAADTWGRDDLPVVGPRLLVPFRVHHINPNDFVSRPFVDTNGEVALPAALTLAGAFAIPLHTGWGLSAAVFVQAFCSVGMLTNQIHQWAHRPQVPALVRLAQRAGLILVPSAHAVHHRRPYHARYCIATGWCNAALDRIGFFRRLEELITWLTGMRPRQDDRRYERRYRSDTSLPEAFDAGG